MEPLVVARAMAREQWDRQYFSREGKAHGTNDGGQGHGQEAVGQAVLQ